MGTTGKILWVGCFITVLSQAGALCCLAVDKIRIKAHLSREKAIVCCEECSDLLLAFPWGSAISFIGCLVGFAFLKSGRQSVNEALEAMGSKTSGAMRMYSSGLLVSFIACFVVNIIALCVGFLGASKTREFIFGNQSASQASGLLQCFRALAGPWASKIIMALLTISTTVILIFSYLFMFVMLMLLFLSTTCASGDEAMAALDEFINITNTEVPGQPDLHRNWAGRIGRSIDSVSPVEEYCKIGANFGGPAINVFLGCVLMVVSQVAMMVSTSTEKERVAMEMSTCHRTADGMTKNRREVELGESLKPGPPMPSTRF